MKHTIPVAWPVLVALLVACQAPPSLSLDPVQEKTPAMPTIISEPTGETPVDVFSQNALLGRGVNLGNALEAPEEGDWGMTLQEEFFPLIREQGFDSVRIPIRWSAHAQATAPFTIDQAFMARVDWAIEQAFSQGLAVVINMHHYDEIFEDPAGHRDRFLALWDQIARRFQDYPNSLFFEPLNEPHDALNARAWNDLLREALATIRASNPERTIIVGPADWNGVNAVRGLVLPADDNNLIVTVHYYLPFQFTHQGAEWVDGSQDWIGTTWTATPRQQRSIERDLGRVAELAAAQNRPVYLGEFGAYSRADMESRSRWTDFVARQAESLGMSWAYWEFGAGFGVYDRSRGAWRAPLLEALIPAS